MVHKCINEERLRKLEHSEAIMGTKIENLTKELERLTSTIRSLIFVMIPAIISALAFLVVQYLR